MEDGELWMEDGGRRLRKGRTEIAKGAAHSEWKGNMEGSSESENGLVSWLLVDLTS